MEHGVADVTAGKPRWSAFIPVAGSLSRGYRAFHGGLLTSLPPAPSNPELPGFSDLRSGPEKLGSFPTATRPDVGACGPGSFRTEGRGEKLGRTAVAGAGLRRRADGEGWRSVPVAR